MHAEKNRVDRTKGTVTGPGGVRENGRHQRKSQRDDRDKDGTARTGIQERQSNQLSSPSCFLAPKGEPAQTGGGKMGLAEKNTRDIAGRYTIWSPDSGPLKATKLTETHLEPYRGYFCPSVVFCPYLRHSQPSNGMSVLAPAAEPPVARILERKNTTNEYLAATQQQEATRLQLQQRDANRCNPRNANDILAPQPSDGC